MGDKISDDLNEILVTLWRKGVKRLGPLYQLLVEETKHVAPDIAAIEKNLTPYVQKREIPEETKLNFLLYHWPLFYQEGLSLLGEIPRPLGNLLSIGVPYAPYAIAGGVLGAREITFLDVDFHSMNVAAEIAGRLGVTLQTRKTKDPLPKNTYDTIVIDHLLPTLEEIDQTSSLLRENGFLLIVEGASKEQNKAFVEMRDHLVERGFAVQAPCVWKGACPAREFNFPCFAQRALEKTFVMKELQKRAGIEQNSLKMSYIILRKKGAIWPTLPETPLYRVVSGAMEGPSGKRFTLCGTDGRKRLNLSAKEEYPKEARALGYLKRGELLFLQDEQRRGDDIFTGKGSVAKIIAPLGKPLPEPEEVY